MKHHQLIVKTSICSSLWSEIDCSNYITI